MYTHAQHRDCVLVLARESERMCVSERMCECVCGCVVRWEEVRCTCSSGLVSIVTCLVLRLVVSWEEVSCTL